MDELTSAFSYANDYPSLIKISRELKESGKYGIIQINKALDKRKSELVKNKSVGIVPISKVTLAISKPRDKYSSLQFVVEDLSSSYIKVDRFGTITI